MAAARQRGRIGGRKPKVDSWMKQEIATMKAWWPGQAHIAKVLGLVRSTVYN